MRDLSSETLTTLYTTSIPSTLTLQTWDEREIFNGSQLLKMYRF